MLKGLRFALGLSLGVVALAIAVTVYLGLEINRARHITVQGTELLADVAGLPVLAEEYVNRDRDRAVAQWGARMASIRAKAAAFDAQTPAAQIGPIIRVLDTAFAEVVASRPLMPESAAGAQASQDTARLRFVRERSMAQIRVNIFKLVDRADSVVHDAHARLKWMVLAGGGAIIALLSAGGLTGLIGLYLASRRTLVRVEAIRQGALAIAAGNLAVPLADQRPDELGEMARALDRMAQRLGELIRAGREQVARLESEIVERGRSEARFLATFNQAIFGISHVDLDGRFLAVNPRLCELLGYSEGELLARAVIDVSRPEDVAAGKVLGRSLLSGADAAGTWRWEKRLVSKSGALVWCDVTASVVRDASGEPEYFSEVVQNISKRKQAEGTIEEQRRLLDAILENTADAIVACDNAGKLTFFNRAARMLHHAGVRALDSSEWPAAYDLFHADGLTPMSEEDVPLVQALHGRSVRGVEMAVVPKGGAMRHLLASGSPVTDTQGASLGAVVSMHDITERKQAETKLRDYALRLQELAHRVIDVQEAERVRIARELHDQIGQELTAVRLALAPFKRASHDERALQRMLAVEAAIDAAIEQVRALSVQLRPVQLEYMGLDAALKSELERLERSAGLRFALSVDRMPAGVGQELTIACYRIAQEAFTNVLRHVQPPEVEVTLGASCGELCLTVRDHGPGFEVAAALASGASAKLGLMGMQERALAVGGRVEITSAPGAGTEVRALLPLSGTGAT